MAAKIAVALPKVSVSLLEQYSPCTPGLAKYRKVFGSTSAWGVTRARLRRAFEHRLDVGWLLVHLYSSGVLPRAAYDAYKRYRAACEPGRLTWERTTRVPRMQLRDLVERLQRTCDVVAKTLCVDVDSDGGVDVDVIDEIEAACAVMRAALPQIKRLNEDLERAHSIHCLAAKRAAIDKLADELGLK